MTAEEASSSDGPTTARSTCCPGRRSTRTTSRWRTSAASATTRPAASSSPTMPPTRWTGYPASSATAWWTSLRGEQYFSLLEKKRLWCIQVSFDWRHLLPLPAPAHNLLHSGKLAIQDLHWVLNKQATTSWNYSFRWSLRGGSATCLQSAWAAWRGGPRGCSAETSNVSSCGTEASSSWEQCTPTTSSLPSPAAQTDSR